MSVNAALAVRQGPKDLAGGMSRIQTAEAFLHWWFAQADSDSILRRAGITRSQLRVLEADDEVSQCKDTHKDAVVNTPWRLEPNQDRGTQLIADVLKPWASQLIGNAVEAVSYGYSVTQLNWAQRGGLIDIASAWQCPLEWFQPTYLGDLRAAQTIYFADGGVAASAGESVLAKYPGVYFHVVRNGNYTQPYGEALLSRLYYPVMWRRQGWGLWLGYLETFAQPIVIGQTQDFNGFVEALRAQGLRSVVGYQDDQDSRITTISGAQSGEFERLEQNLLERIQRLYLGQIFSSGNRGVGGYAAGKVLELVRMDKRNSAIRIVVPFMQKICDTVADLNGVDRCKFVMADGTGLEAERAERDAKLLPVLTASGLSFSRDYFTDRYDYTDSDLIEATVQEAVGASVAATITTDAKDAASLPAADGITPQEYLDKLVTTSRKVIGEPIARVALEKAIDSASDIYGLEAALKAVLLKKDDKEKMMAQGYLAARVVGLVEEDVEQR